MSAVGREPKQGGLSSHTVSPSAVYGLISEWNLRVLGVRSAEATERIEPTRLGGTVGNRDQSDEPMCELVRQCERRACQTRLSVYISERIEADAFSVI